MMSVCFRGSPGTRRFGDIDLTGYRKPQSYYRDILWNGGNSVFATVRLPEPEGKKIIAIAWASTRRCRAGRGPDRKEKTMQVDVYAGTEKVRLLSQRQTDRRKAYRPPNSNARPIRCSLCPGNAEGSRRER